MDVGRKYDRSSKRDPVCVGFSSGRVRWPYSYNTDSPSCEIGVLESLKGKRYNDGCQEQEQEQEQVFRSPTWSLTLPSSKNSNPPFPPNSAAFSPNAIPIPFFSCAVDFDLVHAVQCTTSSAKALIHRAGELRTGRDMHVDTHCRIFI